MVVDTDFLFNNEIGERIDQYLANDIVIRDCNDFAIFVNNLSVSKLNFPHNAYNTLNPNGVSDDKGPCQNNCQASTVVTNGAL